MPIDSCLCAECWLRRRLSLGDMQWIGGACVSSMTDGNFWWIHIKDSAFFPPSPRELGRVSHSHKLLGIVVIVHMEASPAQSLIIPLSLFELSQLRVCQKLSQYQPHSLTRLPLGRLSWPRYLLPAGYGRSLGEWKGDASKCPFVSSNHLNHRSSHARSYFSILTSCCSRQQATFAAGAECRSS